MVSFSCEGCGDIIKKPKLDQHVNRCRNAEFTCIDCNTTFVGLDYRGHTSCISEDQKYQKALFKGGKGGKGAQAAVKGVEVPKAGVKEYQVGATGSKASEKEGNATAEIVPAVAPQISEKQAKKEAKSSAKEAKKEKKRKHEDDERKKVSKKNKGVATEEAMEVDSATPGDVEEEVKDIPESNEDETSAAKVKRDYKTTKRERQERKQVRMKLLTEQFITEELQRDQSLKSFVEHVLAKLKKNQVKESGKKLEKKLLRHLRIVPGREGQTRVELQYED